MGEVVKVKPKEFHISSHIFWLEYALQRTMVLDFLSERAQRSIAAHLAEAVVDFYRFHALPSEEKLDAFDREILKYDRYQYFQRAMLEHPLGDLFGEKFAKAVDKSCVEVYALLEQGKDPKIEDRKNNG